MWLINPAMGRPVTIMVIIASLVVMSVLGVLPMKVEIFPEGMSAHSAAISGVAARLCPVLMTSLAMVFGMIPKALEMNEGCERTAPPGSAVIGGLLVSIPSALLVLPLIYAMVRRNASNKGPSLLPEESRKMMKKIFPQLTI